MTTIRRVFIRHSAGPHPGLIQFVGTVPRDLPLQSVFETDLDPDQRKATVRLVSMTPKYAYYREAAVGAVAAPPGHAGLAPDLTPTPDAGAAL